MAPRTITQIRKPFAKLGKRLVRGFKRVFIRKKAARSSDVFTERLHALRMARNANPSPINESTLVAKYPDGFMDIAPPAENPTAPDRLAFLGLPGEIRNKIYGYVFTPLMKNCESCFKGGSTSLSLLQVCRQVYHETHALAYENMILFLRGRLEVEINQKRLRKMRPEHLALIKTVAIDSSFPTGVVNTEAALNPTCLIAHMRMPPVANDQPLRQHVNVLRGILYNLWLKLMLMEVKSLNRICLIEGGGAMDWVQQIEREFRKASEAAQSNGRLSTSRKWRLWEEKANKEIDPEKVQRFTLFRDVAETRDETWRTSPIVRRRMVQVEFYKDWPAFKDNYHGLTYEWKSDRPAFEESARTALGPPAVTDTDQER